MDISVKQSVTSIKQSCMNPDLQERYRAELNNRY